MSSTGIWRKINSTRVGTPETYSAMDINDIMDLFNGVNTGKAVTINNPWTFQSGLISGGSVTDNSITDAKIAAQTSTKITITNKAQLNNQIAYQDQANIFTGGVQKVQADVTEVLSLYRPNNSFRSNMIGFRQQNDSSAEVVSCQISGGMETSTPGSESGLLTLYAKAAGTMRPKLGVRGTQILIWDSDWSHEYVLNSANLTNHNNITLPGDGDSFAYLNQSQVLLNKDLTDPSNILAAIATAGLADNAVTDAKIAAQTSTKITISAAQNPNVDFLNQAQIVSAAKTFSAGTTFTALPTVNITAVSGVEQLAAYKVNDDTLSSLALWNSIAADGHFAPGWIAKYLGNLSTAIAFSLTAMIDPAQDTGSQGVMSITSKNNDNTNLANRKVLRILNNTAELFSINANAIDFHNTPFANYPQTPQWQGSPVTGHHFGALVPNVDAPGDGILKGIKVWKTDPGAVSIYNFDGFRTWSFLLTCLGAGHQVEFYQDVSTAYTNMNPRIRLAPYLSTPNDSIRFYCGWTATNVPLLDSNTPLDANTAGILLCFRGALDSTWKVISSAGTGTAVTVYDTHVDKANSAGVIRDFELRSVIASNKWTINPIHTGYAGDTATPNVPQDLATNVPASGTKLYFHCSFQVTTYDTTRTFYLLGLEVEVGSYYGGTP